MKKLNKIQMPAFIVNLLKVKGSTEIFISVLLDAIVSVARDADLMLTDTFDNTLEAIATTMVAFPEHFELTQCASKFKLKNPDMLDQLAQEWTVGDNVKAAMKEYLEKYKSPTSLAGVDMGYSEKITRNICSNTQLIDWLWCRTQDGGRPTTIIDKNNFEVTTTDFANLIRLPELFFLLSRYYRDNLLDHYGSGENSESYMFRYSKNGKERFFYVTMVEDGQDKSYVVQSHCPLENVPYFPDVALGVPSQSLEERKQVIEEARNLFKNARNLSLRYNVLQGVLEDEYGKNIDDRY